MINITKVRDIFSLLAGSLSLQFIRSDQDGVKPEYPFLSYKIMRSGSEKKEQQNKIQKPSMSADKVLFETRKKNRAILSINLFDNVYDRVWENSSRVWDYIDQNRKLICEAHDVLIHIISDEIEDRTVYLENNYEYRLGFDVLVKDLEVSESEADAVDMDDLMHNLLNNE